MGNQPCLLTVFQDITSRKRSEEDLVKAIEAVMADASWFARAWSRSSPPCAGRPGPASPAGGRRSPISPRASARSWDWSARAARRGDRRAQVARNTVRNHVAALFRKLGVNRRSALIVWARERGIGGEELPPRKLPDASKSSLQRLI